MNVGIIGCGDIAMKSYLKNVASRFKNLHLYAVSDKSLERAQRAADFVGGVKVCNVDEMLEDGNVELIFNLTNPQSHYAINRQALLAGKHVYSEKPLALSLEETQELASISNKTGYYLGCAPDTFLGAGAQACKRAILDGAIGKAYSAVGTRFYHGPEIFHPHPDFLYQKGVGPMMDIGPYSIALFLYLLGSPAREVYCASTRAEKIRRYNGREIIPKTDTHYQCIIRLENDQSISFNVSWDVWMPNTGAVLQVFGTDGTLFLPDPNTFSNEAKILQKSDLEDGAGIITPQKHQQMQEVYKPLPSFHSLKGDLRGIGASEMAYAICVGSSNYLCNADFVCHISEILMGCDISAADNSVYQLKTRAAIPGTLDLDFLTQCLQ